MVYQRRKSVIPSKSDQHIPKVKISPPIDLNIDLGNWLSSAKIPFLVIEILKIPSQRDIFMKTLEEPKEKFVKNPKEVITENPKEKIANKPKEIVTNKSDESPARKQNNINKDTPIVLHSRDLNKEDHPSFYISLIANDKLLHNCMVDSGASSNIMTKKVMEKMGLRITRPYQNVCAMDSREIDVVGIILNFPVKLAAYPDIGVV